jgi:hypothetical protein
MDPCLISDQVTRILGSQTFARKSQLRKLLEILHQNMDVQTSLKTDQIIEELWPGEVRTKGAADVATEMNRLRHALKTYYEDEGADDQITICFPNRTPIAGNGTQERPWMVAEARSDRRGGQKERPPSAATIPQRRPRIITWTAALVFALCAAAYFSVRVLILPDQPHSARFDGSNLVILDAQGGELWRKFFPEGFGPDWYYAEWQPTRIWFGDLEGKGHTSVLFSYSPAGQLSRSSTLICYSDRGEEKWRWTPGRELPELAGSPATFITHAVRVLKATHNRPPRLVVLSQHSPWWPSQLAILDSNGKTLSEYWHSGGLSFMTLADLDGDGREEIIATGTANGYDHQATLVVLDPDRVFGASAEVRPEFQIHGMGVAQERLRLLFPRSDLNRALFQYDQATEPTFEHGALRVTVKECTTPFPGGCEIWYEFDKSFRLIAAYAGSDEFRSAHERFFQTGKNAHTLSEEEKAVFQKVRCLVGCKTEFVPVSKLVP